jgi:hypothetical protein
MSLDIHLTRTQPTDVYWVNITHNLTPMAREAGIYEALWRPETVGLTRAEQLIPLLTEGLKKLKEDPEKYRAFNPPNGWGSLITLISAVEEYLAACKRYPDAAIEVSR